MSFTWKLPRERVAAAVEMYLEASGETAKDLAVRAGVSERALYAVRRGRGAMVRFVVADRLLCAMGASALWIADPEQGGFRDVYLPELDEVAA